MPTVNREANTPPGVPAWCSSSQMIATSAASPPSPLGMPVEDLLAQPLAHWRTQLGEALDRAYLSALLAATRGRIGDAARRAGLSERSLYNMMQRYALRKESFRRGESS